MTEECPNCFGGVGETKINKNPAGICFNPRLNSLLFIQGFIDGSTMYPAGEVRR